MRALVIAKDGSKLHEVTGDSGAGVKFSGFFLVRPGTPGGMNLLSVGTSMRNEDPLVDRTGLEGVYEFNLDFDNNRFPNAPHRQNLPELPAALEQQLGLRLEERKEPTDILVIDHLEKASPN